MRSHCFLPVALAMILLWVLSQIAAPILSSGWLPPAGFGLAAQENGLFDAWVAFTDKGIGSAGEREQALRDLEEIFDPRALERRLMRRTLPGLFDDHDLPLAPEYLAGVAATGAGVKVRSRWLNGVTVLGTRAQLVAIEELSYVEEVTDIHPHVPKGERSVPVPRDRHRSEPPPAGSDAEYGRSAVQVRQLGLHRLHRAGYRGAGVRIGVIDTGFLTSHPAFHNPEQPIRVVGEWDFMDQDPVTSPEPGDSPIQHEHGTLILGALAANAPGELVGSAPEAEFILLKAEDDATEYFLEERWFVAALEYAEAHGADVVTSSVVLYAGYDGDDVDGRTSVMARGWNLAVGNGVIGLQGGGNAGHDDDPETHNMLPPAGVAGIITVGAVDASGQITRFSSDGFLQGGHPKPELLAMGLGTTSVSPFDLGAYTSSAGTSVATPVLAGAVACVLQANPEWTVNQMRTALFRSGDHYLANGRPDPLFVHGYGIPDVYRAAGLSETGR